MRTAQAVRLRLMGFTYDRIARELGYSDPSGPMYAVTRALQTVVKEPSEQLLTLEIERMTMLLSRFIPMAMKARMMLDQQGKPTEQEDPQSMGAAVKAGHLVDKYLTKYYSLTGIKLENPVDVRILKEYDVTNSPENL